MVALIVHFLVKPGNEDRARELIERMSEATRAEPGCLMYVGHQSTSDPRRFLFYEQYVDANALEAHKNSEHFAKYVTGGLDPIIETRTRELFRPVLL